MFSFQARYFAHRIKPVFIFFLALEALLRLAFMMQQTLSAGTAMTVRMFAIGAAFDMGVFAYVVPVFVAYLVLLPSSWHGAKPDRVMTAMLYFLAIFLLLCFTNAQWLFWSAFTSRISLLSVDRVEGMGEIFTLLTANYRLGTVLILLAAVALIIAILLARRVEHAVNLHKPTAPATFNLRLSLALASLLLPAASFLALSQNYAMLSPDVRVNEIAKNGMYSIAYSYRMNHPEFLPFLPAPDAPVSPPPPVAVPAAHTQPVPVPVPTPVPTPVPVPVEKRQP